ncbi:transcriptional regulator, TrmB [Methanococcus vannielii SB]|jgi:predicted transcriptional regulator|uniref:Transcriptional regulator, TrmB n=1 Tax=Methanococcus vannielii (strain ATCC 35089 / DSM 1224 / JCM 13029 / OCM 148 / SB) TaxID=406327 RepID=A6UN57_METVS|nr:helix-turn-helix domain-containing protein [Methanococcus vannielii]ABR53929.1 transcriptional regulator, TrmB [Methanococcus vannielii SB]
MSKLVLNMPCSTFTLESIMCCVFGLKAFDVAVYFEILKNNPSKINEVADSLNRDRSTIQRSAQNLINAGLLVRKQINIKEGGYFYKYEAISFLEVKELVKKSMEQWCIEVRNWIDEIDENDAKEVFMDLI